MLEDLLPYYEQELTHLRGLSGEFAQRYPKIARRLLIDGDQSEDPHVERMIEAFAFLTARVHRKIDDEFPEITEGFLQVLYPHYTNPIPSCTLLQLETDPDKPEITGKFRIPRHHPANSPTVGGLSCTFRTCYDVDLWPISVKSVKLQLTQGSDYLKRLAPNASAAITIELETQGGLPIAQIGLDRLRFFLDGDPSLMHLLHESLLCRTAHIRVSDGDDTPAHTTVLPASAISAVGFEDNEGLLDYDNRSFKGYRLLTEYFVFPEKFLFLDISGLDHAALQHKGTRLQLQIFLNSYPDTERHHRLAQTIGPSNFKLGCTPAINLFKHAADPVRLTHQQTKYAITADARRARAYEVISIDTVTYIERAGNNEKPQEVAPFYSIHHHSRAEKQRFYWYATRERSTREDDLGTDMELALVDNDFSPTRPELEVLSLNLTCSNRDLPEQIPFGGSSGTQTDFTLPQIAIVKRSRTLRKPTPSYRLPSKRGLQWRLISHLSLNFLSIVEHGKDALQEMLTLYNMSQSQTTTRQISGIIDIQSKPATTRVVTQNFSGFVRGTDITLTLDETAFVGAGMVLFASILERFFALYSGPNSFTRLTLRSKQQEEDIVKWPARAGEALVI